MPNSDRIAQLQREIAERQQELRTLQPPVATWIEPEWERSEWDESDC